MPSNGNVDGAVEDSGEITDNMKLNNSRGWSNDYLGQARTNQWSIIDGSAFRDH